MFINKLASIRPEFFFNHKARLFFLKKKKKDLRMAVIVLHPTVHLRKPKGTINSN